MRFREWKWLGMTPPPEPTKETAAAFWEEEDKPMQGNHVDDEQAIPAPEIDDAEQARIKAAGEQSASRSEIIGSLVSQKAEIDQLSQALQQMHGHVMWLTNQKADATHLLERNTRVSALDLAIKALPESTRDPEVITEYAAAFAAWIRGGDN